MTGTGPCEWPIDYGECTPSSKWEALTDEQRARYEDMATAYLWNWTGRVLGVCEVTISPCRDWPERPATFWGSGPGRQGDYTWRPVLIAGLWYNLSCWSCGNRCGCEHPSVLRLPGPVQSVTEVVIDGTTLDPTEYRVDSGSYLVRIDGTGWPTDPDRWHVTYEKGTPVPVGGQVAAGVLAVELFKAACGDSGCALPKRFQSITRQGVTVAAVLDSFDDIDRGHTGIWIIDSWVSSLMAPPRPSLVYSPDTRRR